MNVERILEIKNLSKNYGDLKAVDGISFSVNRGEIVGLLGPNGAGKTTTIEMILGILTPSGGSVRVFNKDFSQSRREILNKINFAASVYAQLPWNLTVRENLLIFARLYGLENPVGKTDSFLKKFDLEKFGHTRTGALSSGEQARLYLAKALLNNPELLLLDEPTASLDPSASDIIRRRILDYVSLIKAGVLWTSHDMIEIERVCHRVLFISHGKILLEGNPKELPGQYGKKDLEELFISVAREPLAFDNAQ